MAGAVQEADKEEVFLYGRDGRFDVFWRVGEQWNTKVSRVTSNSLKLGDYWEQVLQPSDHASDVLDEFVGAIPRLARYVSGR